MAADEGDGNGNAQRAVTRNDNGRERERERENTIYIENKKTVLTRITMTNKQLQRREEGDYVVTVSLHSRTTTVSWKEVET